MLSVGTQVYRGDDGKPIRAASATLEVTPEEAERLAIAVGTEASSSSCGAMAIRTASRRGVRH